jgi:hypothetical protein
MDRCILQTSEKVKDERLSGFRIPRVIETVGFRSTMVIDLTHEFHYFQIWEVEKL